MRAARAALLSITLTAAGMVTPWPWPGPAAAVAQQPAATAAPADGVQLSDRAFAIANKLRCPVCTAESVADSNSEISAEMRALIQQQLDAGKSEAQIIHYFRQRYGDWILLDPPKRGVHLLVWLLPALALLAGVAALAVLFRRWRAAADRTPQADPESLARVRQAIAGRTGGSGAGSGSASGAVSGPASGPASGSGSGGESKEGA